MKVQKSFVAVAGWVTLVALGAVRCSPLASNISKLTPPSAQFNPGSDGSSNTPVWVNETSTRQSNPAKTTLFVAHVLRLPHPNEPSHSASAEVWNEKSNPELFGHLTQEGSVTLPVTQESMALVVGWELPAQNVHQAILNQEILTKDLNSVASLEVEGNGTSSQAALSLTEKYEDLGDRYGLKIKQLEVTLLSSTTPAQELQQRLDAYKKEDGALITVIQDSPNQQPAQTETSSDDGVVMTRTTRSAPAQAQAQKPVERETYPAVEDYEALEK